MILIVEDSALQAKMITDLLAEHQIESEVATSGALALEKAAEQRFNLMLLDMVLPDTSGLNLLSQLKSKEATKNLPVIILSGLTDKENTVEALSRGVNDYITKPYHPQELITRINNQLKVQETLNKLHQASQIELTLLSILNDDVLSPYTTLLELIDKIGNAELLQDTLKEDVKMMSKSAVKIYSKLESMQKLIQ